MYNHYAVWAPFLVNLSKKPTTIYLGFLITYFRFIGSRAILSGPAGGVVGYALTTYQKESDLPVIGFDMGGTSTDVSRYAGQYEHVFETTTAGVTIQAPQVIC